MTPGLATLLSEGEKDRPWQRTGRADDDDTLRAPWIGEDGCPIIGGRLAGVPSVPIASEWRRRGEEDILCEGLIRKKVLARNTSDGG